MGESPEESALDTVLENLRIRPEPANKAVVTLFFLPAIISIPSTWGLAARPASSQTIVWRKTNLNQEKAGETDVVDP